MIKKLFFLTLISLLLYPCKACSLCYADSVSLKDETVITGTIVRRGREYLCIYTDNGLQKVANSCLREYNILL